MPLAAALEKVLLDAAQNNLQGFNDLAMLPNDLQLYVQDMDIKQLTVQPRMLPNLLRVYNEKNPQTIIKR